MRQRAARKWLNSRMLQALGVTTATYRLARRVRNLSSYPALSTARWMIHGQGQRVTSRFRLKVQIEFFPPYLHGRGKNSLLDNRNGCEASGFSRRTRQRLFSRGNQRFSERQWSLWTCSLRISSDVGSRKGICSRCVPSPRASNNLSRLCCWHFTNRSQNRKLSGIDGIQNLGAR